MNMTINEAYLKQKQRTARLLRIVGGLLVVASVVLSFLMTTNTLLVLVAYPALFIGFPLWQYSGGQVRYWQAAAKLPPVVLEAVRPGPKHYLYCFVPIGPLVIDYLLVGPEGLLAIELKGVTDDVKGKYKVTCRPGQGPDLWRQLLPFLERLRPRPRSADHWLQALPFLEQLARMGEPSLGNPSLALDEKTAQLKAWVAEHVPTRAPVPVWGVVVFRQDATPLQIEEATYEVMHLEDLHAFLNLGQYFDEDMRAATLPVEDRNRLNTAVRGLLGPEPVTPQPPAAKTPVRKLSPEARAEQERVKAIRAARAAAPAAAEIKRKTPAAGAVPPLVAGKPAAPGKPAPPARNGAGEPRNGL